MSKYGVIDIGSNSTRLMLVENDKTLYKKIIVTKLAKGLEGNVLSNEALLREKKAIEELYAIAINDGAKEVFAFGTAALRLASNSCVLFEEIKKSCGIEIEIISGEQEAFYGAMGALSGCDGGIIDVGGASTEIVVVKANKIVYSKSINIGAVVLCEKFKNDINSLNGYILDKIKEYGDVPKANFRGIGGTATSVASIIQELEPYDPAKVDGFIVDKDHLFLLKDKLFSLSLEQRKKVKGLHPERAEIIPYGISILCAISEKFNIKNIIVSEKDNLEGYFNHVRGRL